MNVGQIAVLDVERGKIVVYVRGPRRHRLPSGARFLDDPARPFYAEIDDPCARVTVPAKVVAELSDEFRHSHNAIIDSAVARKRRSPHKNAHSPGVIKYLNRVIRENIPKPSWDMGKRPPTEVEGSTRFGQGFGVPEQNRMVEEAAVKLVKRRYEADGWTATSVESENCGYDLVCRKGKAERHVEVKGLSGSKASFLITANEHAKAFSDRSFMLAVVCNARTKKPRVFEWTQREVASNFKFVPMVFQGSLRNRAAQRHHRTVL